MDENDGVLPVSVDYRVFRQMYSKLHKGIESGLSEVVSEVFAPGMITSYTKSVAENLCLCASSRVSTVLDALHQRIRTHSGTFDQFVDILEASVCFSYLAKEMRQLKLMEVEKEAKRMEDIQKEENVQMEKRQGLQLSVNSPPRPPSRPSAAYPETHSSPMCSTVRRVENHPVSSPVMVGHGGTPKSFGSVATPNLGQSFVEHGKFSSTPFPVSERKQAAVVYHSLTHIASRVVVVAEVTQPSLASTDSLVNMSAESTQTTESESRSFAEPPTEYNTVLPDTETEHSKSEFFENEQLQGTPPSMVTTAPTPGSTVGLQPSSIDVSEYILINSLKSTSIQNLRTNSVESSVSSTCSGDFVSAPTSLQENESEDSQESVDTPHRESFVNVKFCRSISCEDCVQKQLKEAERKIAELQLETSQLQAAYESNARKHLNTQRNLQSELYELKLSLYNHQQANEEWQRHCQELLRTNMRLVAENNQLKEDLGFVKADAYDRIRTLECERSKHHRCPNCNTEFYYN